MGKTSQRFNVRTDQHQKILKSWFDGSLVKPAENFSAIGQCLAENYESASNYRKKIRFNKSGELFSLYILKALGIKYSKPSLCKHKKLVYQTRPGFPKRGRF